MAELRDDEIRRILKFLKNEIEDAGRLARIEDELRGEFAAEFLREPEILSFFREEILELAVGGASWRLRIIGYTKLRMTQRGISREAVINLFRRFIEFCRAEDQPITVGAYTIFGKPFPRSPAITLRIDVDAVEETKGAAHTVTIFVGRGESYGAEEINLM